MKLVVNIGRGRKGGRLLANDFAGRLVAAIDKEVGLGERGDIENLDALPGETDLRGAGKGKAWIVQGAVRAVVRVLATNN